MKPFFLSTSIFLLCMIAGYAFIVPISRHSVSFLTMQDSDQPSATEEKKTHKKKKLLNQMLQRTKHQRTRNPVEISTEEDPTRERVEAIVKAGDNRKAHNIMALRVEEWTEVTSYIIIMEGNSKPQLRAIALAIEEDVKEQFGSTPYGIEADSNTAWVLLDYGSIIVHIMTPQMRSYYKLEKRWKDAELLEIAHLVTPSGREREEGEGGWEEMVGEVDEAEEGEGEEREMEIDEEDPFWS